MLIYAHAYFVFIFVHFEEVASSLIIYFSVMNVDEVRQNITENKFFVAIHTLIFSNSPKNKCVNELDGVGRTDLWPNWSSLSGHWITGNDYSCGLFSLMQWKSQNIIINPDIYHQIPLRTIWMGRTIKLLDFAGKCHISLAGLFKKLAVVENCF